MKLAEVDACIEQFSGWQRGVCLNARELIHIAAPNITEELRYGNRPYFLYKGSVCALQATKDHVNVFIYDPIAPDPYSLINQGHDNKTARAIQIYEGESPDEKAFVELIKSVVANNVAGGWRKLTNKE